MEPEKKPPVERPEELELAPQPRIKKLSSAIVWIAAIFAVAVLWVVGYVVSSKARKPASDRRITSIAPPAENLAERIQRAAEREARLAAERAAAERAKQLSAPPPLPPGFEELLAAQPEPPARPVASAGRSSGRPAADPKKQTLQRALDSELVPTAFRSAGPRVAGGGDVADPFGPPPMSDLASIREELIREARASEEPVAAVEVRSVPDSRPRIEPNGSPFRLVAGTLIPAVLTSGINSDLPGQTTALVRRNVYDSITGRYLLIPQGTRLVGEYDSRVAFGQKRVLVAWNRLVFPDGRSLDLQGMPGVDLSAAAGLHDKVNNHFVRTFGSALMLAAVSAGVQLSQPADDSTFSSNPTPSQIAAAAVGQELGRVATEYLRRSLDVRPTLEVRPGYQLNVEVTSDLHLDGPYPESAPTGL